MKWLKYIGIGILLSGFAVYLVWALRLGTRSFDAQLCLRHAISWVNRNPELSLIENEDIENLLFNELKAAQGKRLNNIPIHSMEKELESLSEIKNAEVFTRRNGSLEIRLEPSKVVASIFTADEKQFYLDEDGKVIQARFARSAKVPVISGAVYYPAETVKNVYTFQKEHPSALHKWMTELHAFTQLIASSDLWRREVQQIEVLSAQDIRLYMLSHDCAVKLGSLDNFAYKMHKLELFYKKGFEQVGWNTYETIDLQYSNQLVCKKKD